MLIKICLYGVSLGLIAALAVLLERSGGRDADAWASQPRCGADGLQCGAAAPVARASVDHFFAMIPAR